MTLTIHQLATEVQRQKAATVDVVADTRRVSFGDGPQLPNSDRHGTVLCIDMPDGAEEFGVTRHAHQQIAAKIDVPFKTYERLLVDHPPLFTHLTNGLLSREPSTRLIRTLDGRARAFLSDRYQPRDNWQLLEHLLPVLNEFPAVEFRSCDLTDTRMYVKTFLPAYERQITPKEGDVIRGGVIIQNSEVGNGSLGIYPYTDRLICTNGAIHTDFGQRYVHLGRQIANTEEAYEFYSTETMQLDAAAFFAKAADTLRGCLNESVFDAIAQQMRDLADIRVPGSPVDAVKVITKEKFTDGEADSILTHLVEGGDLSAWGYVNAITRTARDLDDADRQTEIQKLAGDMISEPKWALAVAA